MLVTSIIGNEFNLNSHIVVPKALRVLQYRFQVFYCPYSNFGFLSSFLLSFFEDRFSAFPSFHLYVYVLCYLLTVFVLSQKKSPANHTIKI